MFHVYRFQPRACVIEGFCRLEMHVVVVVAAAAGAAVVVVVVV